jgi:GAF domain-containing protein
MWLATDAVQEAKREAFESGAYTWQSWNNTAYVTTSGTTSVPVTWQSWNTSYTAGNPVSYGSGSISTSGMTLNQWTYWNGDREETAEEHAEREAARVELRRLQEERDAERLRRAEEQRLERNQARDRARELLRSLLSDAQWASYEENGWFEVRGSRGGRWRIRDRGQSGNVDLMPEIGDERDATYCAHPPGGLPDADAHIAQMLALVTDEEAFVRVANVRYRRQGTVPPFMRAVA